MFMSRKLRQLTAFLLLACLPLTALASVEDGTPRPHPIPDVEIAELDAAMLRGLDFLLKHQRKNGSFGSPFKTKSLNIYAPGTSHAGFHAGTNALALAAMIELEGWIQTLPEDTQNAQFAAFRARLPQLSGAITRCEAWTMKTLPELRRSDINALYNVWGHAYGIQALCRMMTRKMDIPADELTRRQSLIRAEVAHQVSLLDRFECLNGGWGYYDFDHHLQKNGGGSNSFVTATVMVALDEARRLGVEVPERITGRGVKSILRQRRPNNAYCYGEDHIYSTHIINRPAGSLGRTVAASYALRQWGEEALIPQELLVDGLDRFVARIGWQDMGRKRPKPHESWFAVAGYFYYYGHYYAILCVEELEDPALRRKYANYLTAINLALQERDGSWWDFPLYDYHQAYGTGMALTVLLKCRSELVKEP